MSCPQHMCPNYARDTDTIAISVRQSKNSDQGFGSVFIWYGSGTWGWYRSGSGSRVLMTKIEKNLQLENKFSLSKTTIYLSLGLYKWRPSYRQCCGTVTIFYGSGSYFWKVLVPVPVPTFEKVMVPVPAPTFEKLRFRFRFRFQLHI